MERARGNHHKNRSSTFNATEKYDEKHGDGDRCRSIPTENRSQSSPATMFHQHFQSIRKKRFEHFQRRLLRSKFLLDLSFFSPFPSVAQDCSVQNDRELTEISSYSSVIIARTRTESIIDRSSPYNIIETSTDEEEKQQMDLSKGIEVSLGENQSPGSSMTSGTDVYMDAVDALDEENPGKYSIFYLFSFVQSKKTHFRSNDSDEPTTPVDYGSFSKETVEAFALNLHRIDKDVARCDRNYPYFMYNDNLNKLRNIMCTSVIDLDEDFAVRLIIASLQIRVGEFNHRIHSRHV